MLKLPSESQIRYLRFIKEYHDINSFYPTFEELAKGLCISKEAVRQVIVRLDQRGWIIRSGKSRKSIAGFTSKTMKLFDNKTI